MGVAGDVGKVITHKIDHGLQFGAASTGRFSHVLSNIGKQIGSIAEDGNLGSAIGKGANAFVNITQDAITNALGTTGDFVGTVQKFGNEHIIFGSNFFHRLTNLTADVVNAFGNFEGGIKTEANGEITIPTGGVNIKKFAEGMLGMIQEVAVGTDEALKQMQQEMVAIIDSLPKIISKSVVDILQDPAGQNIIKSVCQQNNNGVGGGINVGVTGGYVPSQVTGGAQTGGIWQGSAQSPNQVGIQAGGILQGPQAPTQGANNGFFSQVTGAYLPQPNVPQPNVPQQIVGVQQGLGNIWQGSQTPTQGVNGINGQVNTGFNTPQYIQNLPSEVGNSIQQGLNNILQGSQTAAQAPNNGANGVLVTGAQQVSQGLGSLIPGQVPNVNIPNFLGQSAQGSFGQTGYIPQLNGQNHYQVTVSYPNAPGLGQGLTQLGTGIINQVTGSSKKVDMGTQTDQDLSTSNRSATK